jgi:hypothetical protein
MKLIRRFHLYFGLALMPWFLAYGVSSIPFSHPDWGARIYEDGRPMWTVLWERPWQPPVQPQGNLRPFAAAAVAEARIEGAFGAYRPSPERINVYVHSFRGATQLVFDQTSGTLRAESRRFRWDHFLTGLHARGGYIQDRLGDDLWAIVVDLFCAAMILWVVTGLLMWWRISGHRLSGGLVLAGSFGLFGALLALL